MAQKLNMQYYKINQKVASLDFVGDSILGKSTRIGSGCILANRRFDQKNIEIKIDGKKI